VKRATYKRRKVQIRIICDDPETVLALMKRVIEALKLENAEITGVYPNRKEPGYRGYVVAEVVE